MPTFVRRIDWRPLRTILMASCVAVLPALLGCDLLDRAERLVRPCPEPSLSSFDTEDLIHELIDRGLDNF
jgi:hypothetical protein